MTILFNKETNRSNHKKYNDKYKKIGDEKL